MKAMRVGIAGCGSIFHTHADALAHLPGITLAAVCDILPERAKRAADEYGCAAYTDFRSMIDTAELDAVHICTPHYLHPPMTVYALEHGLDVVCEKPMAIRLKDAKAMAETARNTGRRLCIIFQNRYNPGSVLVRRALEDGTLGAVRGARCEVCWHRDEAYYKSGDWRGRWDTEGGGVVINQAVHTLDLMRWLVGDEVTGISARLSRRPGSAIEVEDTAEGALAFRNGATGLFYLTNNYCCDARTLVELVCENGVARIDGAVGAVTLNDGRVLTGAGEDPAAASPGGKDAWGRSHCRQIAGFYEDESGKSAAAGCAEALKTQELICGIYAAGLTPDFSAGPAASAADQPETIK